MDIIYSNYSAKGLTIACTDCWFAPRWSGLSLNRLSYDFDKDVSAYQHEKAIGYGDKSATFTLNVPLKVGEDWWYNGLGRHIEVLNPGGAPCWRGFANKITLRGGTITKSVGPLLDIGNRVGVTFNEVLDNTVNPSVKAVTAETTLVDDDVSQDKYGIIEKRFSAGTCTRDEADYVRDLCLEEYAYPESSDTVNINVGQSQNPTVTVECLGYVSLFDMYIYNATTAGTQTISNKILAVIAANPNTGALSTDYGLIVTNALLVTAQENESRFASDIIRSLLTVGDINNRRYDFGVDSWGKVFYQQIPYYGATSMRLIDYYHQVTANRQQLVDAGTLETVAPWDMISGKYCHLTDFAAREGDTFHIIGRLGSHKGDPRNILIETLQYTYPLTLTLNGGKYGRPAQALAKTTMSGGYF